MQRRLNGVDLRNPTVAEGLRICLLALDALQAKAARNGVRLLILLVPTKELVYGPTVANASEDHRLLVEYEEFCRSEVIRRLHTRRIEVIDALPALRECLAQGGRPYPMSDDGHPSPEGHAILATAVAAALAGNASE